MRNQVWTAVLWLLCACTRMPDRPLKVGTYPLAASEPLYLARALQLYPPQTIHLVEFTSAHQLARAFRNGVIDAATVPLVDALRFEQMGQRPRVVLLLDASPGAHAPLDNSPLPGEPVDVLVVREDALAEQVEQVEALLRGWLAALGHYQEHPEEDARLMAPRLGQDAKHFQETLAALRLATAHEQRLYLMGHQPRLRATLERLGNLMVESQLLSTPPDTARMLDAAPLARVLP